MTSYKGSIVIFNLDDLRAILPNEDSRLIKLLFENFDPLNFAPESVTDKHVWGNWNLNVGSLYAVNGKFVRFGLPTMYPEGKKYEVWAQVMGTDPKDDRASQDKKPAEALIEIFKKYIASRTPEQIEELKSKVFF